MENNFSITNKTKTRVPTLDFLSIKNAAMGEKYNLSLVFVSKKKIAELNKSYRDRNEPTDILSFELGKTNGEIFICQEIARKKSKEFERKYENFLVFLFIHGLMHLKGMEHGSKMERAEMKLRQQFHI